MNSKRKFSISYIFSPDPRKEDRIGYIKMRPKVILSTEGKKDPEIITHFTPISLDINTLPYLTDDKTKYYSEILKKYRESQERIIADLICAIILKEAREYNEEMVFFIIDNFRTEKIIGRLAYLGLPVERITILLISNNITDLLQRHMVSPFSKDIFDVTVLRKEEDFTLGPYPDADTITLIRTFYKTFGKESRLWPVRINAFCQFLDTVLIEKIGSSIQTDYFLGENTEQTPMRGIESAFTRLPKILISSERRAAIEANELEEGKYENK